MSDDPIMSMMEMAESAIENSTPVENDNVVNNVSTQVEPQTDSVETNEEDKVSVSSLILQNVDKHVNMVVVNDKIHEVHTDADVENYIVYVNTVKNIPCIYDCERLYVPKGSVMDENGNWNVTSIEGRRSGFIIKCPGRDLVMSKNFIYDCVLEDNKIVSVTEINRKFKLEQLERIAIDDFDSAQLVIMKYLPKIIKSKKYTTLDQLKEQVVQAYNSVNDINAMINIVSLRLNLGC